MANQVVPDTESLSVACMALAWDIVLTANKNKGVPQNESIANARFFAQEVRKVYLHLYEGVAIPDAEQT